MAGRDSYDDADDGRWQPIGTAPKDGTLLLVWAPGVEGLNAIFSLCAWHDEAGFCIDELRQPTHWMPLPEPPSAALRGREPATQKSQISAGLSAESASQPAALRGDRT